MPRPLSACTPIGASVRSIDTDMEPQTAASAIAAHIELEMRMAIRPSNAVPELSDSAPPQPIISVR
jgi:hypothetical protein